MPQQGSTSLETMLKQFGAGYTPQAVSELVPSAQAAAQGFLGFLTGQSEGGEGGRRLPTFQDMFERFINLGQEETERSAAAIRESMGARGARYASDTQRMEAMMRSKAAGQLARQGLGAITDVGNVALGYYRTPLEAAATLGGLEVQQREAALNRMWLEFMRQSGVPPLVQPAGQLGSTIGTTQTIAF